MHQDRPPTQLIIMLQVVNDPYHLDCMQAVRYTASSWMDCQHMQQHIYTVLVNMLFVASHKLLACILVLQACAPLLKQNEGHTALARNDVTSRICFCTSGLPSHSL